MSEVERFYDEFADREWERLERHPMELALTLRALHDHLPPPPATILDVGGGPGRYAIALAECGYAVTLVDLARGCLELARVKAAETGVELAGYVQGTVLDLARFSAETYDAVLMLGPLYHLFTLEDRRQAVREAARVLRPGGIVVAAVITRYALIRWAARHRPEWLVEHRAAVERLLETGRAAGNRKVSFTDAYFAHPAELPALLEQAGLHVLDTLAAEGVVSLIDDKLNELAGEPWQAWVDLNYRLSRDPAIHGAAEHLLCIGRK